LQSRTCLFLQLCFFAIAAHQRSRMFAITCIFTKLQPHQAKTKLVTSSFFTSFLQSQSHCYKGYNHTATWFAINYILVCNCLFLCNRSTSVVANTLQRMLQSPVFLDQVATHQAKTILASILQCRGTELFFETGVFFTRVFLKLFFLQNHCSKVAITLL
jgi:hypothetical protein